MPSIFDSSARAELAARLKRLTSDAKPLWGKMNAAQAQKHLEGAAEMAMGRIQIASRPSVLKNALGRWLVIHSPMPWPKGAPTAPQLIPDALRDFEAGSPTLIKLTEEAAALGESGTWADHPAFGKMTGRDWGVMIWRHTDHHLRQFGL
jgi:hypothetical protein